MKQQTEKTDRHLFDALFDRLWEKASPVINVTPKHINYLFAFDSDFLPVTNVNDARWLFGPVGGSIVKLGSDGTMIQLIRA